ncbi:hydantoinase B/oxoprolinase family protein [Rhodococcus aetherivorans]|uniref:hydantoinase B/oxoprolinase family protein n=1 Tax=Rhodococcus aetherivorans TaxID=191292 RepID=UPI0036A50258
MSTSSNSIALRDLDDQEFSARYNCDRFTATVLSNRMRYILEHLSTRILTNAFSPILRDWYDFNATISGPPELNYQMPAVGNSLAAFFGSMSEAVRITIEEFGPENLRPGDIIAANDPYRVGTHVNDVCFIRPVFSGDRIASFVSVKAHQLDIGGVVPGGFSATKHNVFENGLVLAPILLYRDNKPVKSTFNLLFDNSRFGGIILPDIKTIDQSLQFGERLILESVERYGIEAYFGAIRYAVDSSAESMAAALSKIADGTYTGVGYIDADAVDQSREYEIHLSLTKVGDRLEVDFSGTSPQARTSINAAALDAKSAVVMALKFLIDPTTPYTSGAFRNIDVVLPAGTVVSATPPDGAIFMYWEATQPLMKAVFEALDTALGKNAVAGDFGSMGIHNAYGLTDTGQPWGSMAVGGGEHGPWGATKEGDADSYQSFYQANGIGPAVESIEADNPVVILRREYVEDSAGSGYHRGGAAVRKDTMYLTAAEHWTTLLSTKKAPGIGVYGGGDGVAGAAWLFPDEVARVAERQDLIATDDEIYARSTPVTGVMDPESKVLDPSGEYFYYGDNPIWQTTPNSVFRYQTCAGGGWGNPLDREPERVLDDVRNLYASIAGAERDYGVVVIGDPLQDPEGLELDLEATQARRARLRAER